MDPELKEGLLRSMAEPAKKKTIIDLGWANSWTIQPEIVITCKQKGHRRSNEDVGPAYRGLENVVKCLDGCNYVFRYDSSD